MKEKMKGVLAGIVFRMIALLTLGQISPILSACIILEQDGRILLIDRSDGLGYTIPGGIIRYKETIEQGVVREAREETGYHVNITEIVGIYSALDRDPRLRAVSIAYRGHIVGGTEHRSQEGVPGWYEPERAFGHMAFDCGIMLEDYLRDQQQIS